MENTNETNNLPSLSRSVVYLVISSVFAWVTMILLPRLLGPVEAAVMFGTPIAAFVIILSLLLVTDHYLLKD